MYRKSLQEINVKSLSPAVTPKQEEDESAVPGSPFSPSSASSPSPQHHQRLKAKMVGAILCFSLLACLFFLATCILAVKIMFPKDKTSV